MRERGASAFLLRKSVLDKKPPGGKIYSSAWRFNKTSKILFCLGEM